MEKTTLATSTILVAGVGGGKRSAAGQIHTARAPMMPQRQVANTLCRGAVRARAAKYGSYKEAALKTCKRAATGNDRSDVAAATSCK